MTERELPAAARCVVIGGGVAGASIALPTAGPRRAGRRWARTVALPVELVSPREAGERFPPEIGRLAGVRIPVVPIARAWGTDISSVHTPLHAALDAAVRFDTGAFHRAGGAAGPRWAGGPRTRLCLVLEDPLTVALGREPVRVTAPCSAT